MNSDHHRRDDVLDLLALGAAGALSDDEYRALDELLAADPELAREYGELQASAATLAEAASEGPPAGLRASVLDAIRDVDQLAAASPGPTAEPGPARAAPAVPRRGALPDQAANVVPIHHRRWMIPATVAAAFVMLLVGGLLFNRFADAPSDDRMAEVLNDDTAVTIPLTGPLEGLRLVSSERIGASVLMGSGVELPDEGKVFQLWALHEDEKVSMATFMPTGTGEVALVMDVSDESAEWAVTVEPSGGSEQPTTDPVAVSPGLA